MINEKIGNLLTAEEVNVIAHQTNYAGIMSGGIAKSIKNDLLGAKGFFEYTNTCDTQKRNLLGTVLYQTAVNGKIVADMFAQRSHGRVKTDYDALQKCLEEVEEFCMERNYSLGIPGRLGCGLAGGDWKYVYENIIVPIFKDSSVMLYIYYFDIETYQKCQDELGNVCLYYTDSDPCCQMNLDDETDVDVNSEDDVEDNTEDDTEGESEDNAGDGTEDDQNDDTADDTEGDTEDESEDNAGDDPKNGAEDDSEDNTEDDPEDEVEALSESESDPAL